MPLEVRASFLAGFYQGKTHAEEAELYPTPARLFSAFVAGAYTLERLETGGRAGSLSATDDTALAFFEQNAPDAIVLPNRLSGECAATVYRICGDLKKKEQRWWAHRGEPVEQRTYLDGPVCWYWAIEPDQETVLRLAAIAKEVPYLGGSDSPVSLSVGIVADLPDECLKRTEPLFEAEALDIPLPGRLNELDKAYKDQQKVPKKASGAEEEQPFQVPTLHVGTAYYMEESPKEPTVVRIPWKHGYLLEMDRRVGREDYVSAATCLHRALVRQFGDALPLMLQKTHPSSGGPANGLAIQVIPADAPSSYIDTNHDWLLVMIPFEASADDEDRVARALSQITRLYDRGLGEIGVAFTGERINLASFWCQVSEGARRLFNTEPLFLADSRPPSGHKPGDGKWTVEDDARVAFGHVWRDHFLTEASGDKGRIELSGSVKSAGVSVFGGRVVPTNNIRRYTHKTPKGMMLVGERATIDMSCLNCDRCVCAIGQTRHLGGGLLYPLDIPSALSIGAGQSGEEAVNG